jgi:hypothetical protein
VYASPSLGSSGLAEAQLVEPGAKVRALLETGEIAEDLHEHLLAGVVELAARDTHAPKEPECYWVVLAMQITPCLLLTQNASGEKLDDGRAGTAVRGL